MLKAYFDCGNQLDSKQYKTIVLAGMYGPEQKWRRFEKHWELLFKRRQPPYLHTTDAVTLNRSYSKRNGWTSEKANELIERCTDVIADATDHGLSLISCTLVLADYKQAQRDMPALPPPEHICGTYCIGTALNNYCDSEGVSLFDLEVALFFDRNEPFYGHILNLWNRPDHRKKPTWSAIKQISEVEMTVTPAIQAADLLGWSLNRALSDDHLRYPWQFRLLNVERDKEIIDKDYLEDAKRHANAKRYSTLNLPRRRPMP